MNQIDDLMFLADEYAKATAETGHNQPTRQALRAAIEQALAVQPKQEPIQTTGETNVELVFYSDDASNGQQRELVGKVEMGQLVGNRPNEGACNPNSEREIAVIRGLDEYGPLLDWYRHWINFPIGTKLYTAPQPQQWLGLTDEDLSKAMENADFTYAPTKFARAIEAKLREKNGGGV